MVMQPDGSVPVGFTAWTAMAAMLWGHPKGICWRRGWDSNPRYLAVYTISSRA